MSESTPLRRLPATLLAVGSTVAVGFATEALMDGPAAWWWLVLASGIAGLIGGGVWFRSEQRRASAAAAGGEGGLLSGDGHAQQTTLGSGNIVAISSDNGSVAAWNIAGNVTMHRPPQHNESPEQR